MGSRDGAGDRLILSDLRERRDSSGLIFNGLVLAGELALVPPPCRWAKVVNQVQEWAQEFAEAPLLGEASLGAYSAKLGDSSF